MKSTGWQRLRTPGASISPEAHSEPSQAYRMKLFTKKLAENR